MSYQLPNKMYAMIERGIVANNRSKLLLMIWEALVKSFLQSRLEIMGSW
eukprot:CAMPEP_0116892470 /NCGR_PEP_ID=MMETSP0467-20121206/2682_1 /TAXON_ID=283647 /ORGANISM="Mesodinium pulex, Strain SPMC105" /LENGTH=48 /DNA_ID= /DNA_START= /DNA_END= /DNA_ORIENTATION=